MLQWTGLTLLFAVPHFFQDSWVIPVGAITMIAGTAIMWFNYFKSK